MEVQVAAAKVGKYASHESGDSLEMIERPRGGLSLVLVDGQHVLPLASSQDHKRLRDHDEGPNTGGMGAYSPAPVVTAEVDARVRREVTRASAPACRRSRPADGSRSARPTAW